MGDPDISLPRAKSDLGVRALSGAVMIAVAGTALWQGGWLFMALVVAVGLGVLWEFWGLVRRITSEVTARALWMTFAVAYVGMACVSLVDMNAVWRWFVVLAVIAIDTAAYFAGRSIGGPKIAPAISPSKTWAGLGGAIIGATLVTYGFYIIIAVALAGMSGADYQMATIFLKPRALCISVAVGAIAAVVAQSGDFFESWMKRRAGVKDSGALIPGHGGLFDRVDGLLPVAVAVGAMLWAGML
jgi:phosphatidate cytidylyltransferase